MTVDASNVVITTTTEDPATGDTVVITDGVETERIPPSPERVAFRANLAAMKAAFEANKAFIASSPTSTEALAQVKTLTQQVNHLIKFVASEITD